MCLAPLSLHDALPIFQNYCLLSELLAPGVAMPLVDTDALRAARVAFVHDFCERPYYFVRAATPQVLLDEVDRIL
jgi:hypothetical protein